MIKRVIALGFFDGVHVGHQALLERTAAAARGLGALSCAMTFDNHPDALLLGCSQPLLNTSHDREWLIKRQNIDHVLTVKFDRRLMYMQWRDFVTGILVGEYEAAHLVAGHDFHFGYRGEGNAARLTGLCGELGIGCDIVSEVALDGITVSSTYIRRLVAQGDMERAAQFLGHAHLLSGTVRHGRGLGTKLGSPTLNLDLPAGLQCPAHGVYVSRVYTGGKLWPAVTNVGVRPTVSRDGEVMAESTLLDFSGDLYGCDIRVEFLQFLRPERQFESVELLGQQISRDILAASRFFGQKP